MMIGDVIVQASGEHEIFFLLTAYIESLRYCDKLGMLPAGLTRLPMTGTLDVQRRIEALKSDLETRAAYRSERSNAILREAAEVLSAAFDRLKWLEQQSVAAIAPDALAAAVQPA